MGDYPLRAPAESGLDLHVGDAHLRRLLLVRHEVAQRPEIAEVVVAEGQVEERLTRSVDAEPTERRSPTRHLRNGSGDRQVEPILGEGFLGDGRSVHLWLRCIGRS